MRKNQKYTQEEMYENIKRWQTSGLSQKEFSKQEGYPLTTFSYWLIKYGKQKKGQEAKTKPFLPVEIILPSETTSYECNIITIIYPNGIRVTCPITIEKEYLRTLIHI
jgi:hypothetical protein